MKPDDELITIVDDAPVNADLDLPRWQILVVDDDAEVHDATEYALRGIRILDRLLQLHHAHSAAEARDILKSKTEFAAIILDVVMETSDAGLQLVDHIRNDCQLSEPRIILRTGQPGYAPEMQIFERYDINDYRTKSELSQTRLVTTLLAAVRSYHQIRTIAENRRGLELIVHASSDLMEMRAINLFAEGVLTQIAAFLNLPIDGLVCAQRGLSFSPAAADELVVVGATGRFAKFISHPLSTMAEGAIPTLINTAIAERHHQFGPTSTVLYLRSGQMEGAVFVQVAHLSSTDRSLLEVFTSNIASCYGNVRLVEQLNHAAFHDPLTRVFNRSGFIRILDAIEEKNTGRVVALIDLVHFSDINDGLGHDFGNALLQSVARRLRIDLPESCHIGRIAADVFGVVGQEDFINPLTLLDLFKEPLRCDDHVLPVAVSIGLCRLQDDVAPGVTVLRHANIALNRAKLNLRAYYEYFVPEMEDSPRQRLNIIGDLRQAFETNGLSVWFQPQIVMQTSALWGMEALIRWPNGPDKFVQPPNVFIPLAEYSGLIVDIGFWVLEQACALFVKMRSLPDAPPRVAVNASMVQFRSPNFAARVAAILKRYEVRAEELELEITENLAMDDPKRVLAMLAELKRLGVTIALDDFGTGYSSLSHLDRMPIDCLKIDQSFVAEIGNGHGEELAETIVALGRKLRLTTIAEGVETSEQAKYLRDIGCNVAQGYLFAKPMPPDALYDWLRHRPKFGDTA